MRRILKWTFIGICAVLVLILVSLVGAHLYLATDAGGRKLLSFVNTLYPGKITGRTVEVSLLGQEISLTDAMLKGPDGKIILRAKQAYVRMNLPALLRQDVILDNIYILRPECTLTIDRDGSLNIEKAFVEKTPEVSPYNVYINDLTCEDGSLVFILPNSEVLARSKKLQFKMDAAFTNDTLLHLSIPSSMLDMTLAGKTIDLGSSSISATIFNDSIKYVHISSKKSSSRIALTGSVKNMAQKAQLQLSLDLDVSLADFGKDLGIPETNSGRFAGRIETTGDYDNPSLTCELNSRGGRLSGLDIGSTRLAGTLADRVFTFKELQTHIASGELRLSGNTNLRKLYPKGYFEEHKDTDTISYALSIVGTNLKLSELPGLPKGIKGNLHSKFALEGNGIKPESLSLKGTLSAKVDGFAAPGNIKIPDLSLEGNATYTHGLVQVDPLTAKSADVMLTTRGKANLNSGVINGIMNLKSSQVANFLERYKIPARGSLTGEASVSGTFKKPVAEIFLTGEQWTYKDISIGKVGFKGRLDQTGTLSISECTINNNKSSVVASGSVGLFKDFPHINYDVPMNIEANISALSLHDFNPRIPVSGPFSGRISANGSLSSITGDMRLDGKNISISDFQFDTVGLQTMLKDGMLTVSTLSLTKDGSTLKASGTAQVLQHNHLIHDPEIDFRIQEGALFLENFFKEAKGLMNITGDIQGTLQHPTGNVIMAGNKLLLGTQKINKANVSARLDGDRIWIDPAVIELSPGEHIDGTGWISMKGEYSLSVSSTGLPLETLDVFKNYDGLKGTAVLDISGEGTLKHPMIAGKVLIKNIYIKDSPFKDSQFSFHLLDRTITYEGSLNFNVQGKYDLGSRHYQAYAKFDETDLGPYFIVIGKPLLNGVLTGTISAAGDTADMKSSVIEANLSKVDISLKGKSLVLAKSVVGSYIDGRLSIPKTHIMLGENGSFDLSGSGKWNSLVLDAEGTVPVDVIGSFMEELADSTGVLSFTAHMKPRDTHPEITAQVTLDQFGYTIPYNGQRVHSTNGKIRLENNTIFIEGITGLIENGSFEIGGKALLEGYTPKEIELHSSMKTIPIVIPDTMDLTVDSESSFVASNGQSLLRSNVFILEGTYYKDVKVNLLTGVMERIIPVKRKDKQPSTLMKNPFLQNMALDLTIKRRGDVKVENNIAQLDINPDLKISGTLPEPIVTGRVAVTEGTVTFQRNEFTVSRGVIDFVNPYRTEATVDIKGETKVRTWTIDLAVLGTLDNLQFELSSNPTEQQEDILSLLVVGKTTRELTQNQTGLTVSPSSMMAELVTGTYGEQVKKATSLDILKLETSELATTQKGGESLKLTLGKEISERTTLKYEIETINNQTVQRGVAEYKVLENLLINGYQGSNGIFGADMQFKYEFR
jgi:translocation and assembly module TamB